MCIRTIQRPIRNHCSTRHWTRRRRQWWQRRGGDAEISLRPNSLPSSPPIDVSGGAATLSLRRRRVDEWPQILALRRPNGSSAACGGGGLDVWSPFVFVPPPSHCASCQCIDGVAVNPRSRLLLSTPLLRPVRRPVFLHTVVGLGQSYRALLPYTFVRLTEPKSRTERRPMHGRAARTRVCGPRS